ncbi:MAG: SGNH/GDSL hydrolase family protein [Lysobacteraceae bacterium]
MKVVCWLVLLFVLAVASCTGVRPTEPDIRVLFLGNSLIYENNLPGVFDALALRNGRLVHSDMIVNGGATLDQWHSQGAVDRAMSSQRYDVVILQERGGDLLGGFGADAKRRSEQAIKALAVMIRERGARPVMLGTYQPDPRFAAGVAAAELEFSSGINLEHLSLANMLARGQSCFPDAQWIAADGAHPGPDLTLLEAVLLHLKLFGEFPSADGFRFVGSTFVEHGQFLPPDPVSRSAMPAAENEGHTYTAARVSDVIAVASNAGCRKN